MRERGQEGKTIVFLKILYTPYLYIQDTIYIQDIYTYKILYIQVI